MPDSDDGRGAPRRGRRLTTREVALLGLMAALWAVVEMSVGGMIKAWRVPFGGSLLSTCGVVVLLTARASVPRRGSSLIVGVVTAGIRFASAFSGAPFAAIGILVEAAVIEAVLWSSPRPNQARRMLAGGLAVLWALFHPFVVQGYLAGLGPRKVYGFTIALIAGKNDPGSLQSVLVLLFLGLVHVALGVSAVVFVDRILLAPIARAARPADPTPSRAKSAPPSGGGGSAIRALAVAGLALGLCAGAARAQATDGAGGSRAPSAPVRSVYALPEYTVVGTRLYGPYAVLQVNPSDLEQAGATDLSEALELVPGLVIRSDSRGEARLSTRGLAEREIVVLVDGVPIADPYTGSVNLAAVLAGGVGAVRVTKGPVASVYGANAMGGIVEVSAPSWDGTGISYLLSGGTDGRYSGHVAGSGSVRGVRLSGGAAARATADFSLPASFPADKWEEGGTREYSAREDAFAWARASFDPTPRTTATLSFQVSDGRRDVPASTSADRPRFWSFPFWRETRTVGSLRWRPGDLSLDGNLFFSTNDNELASYADYDRTQRRWQSSVSNRGLGGYVLAEYKGVPGQTLAAGLNVRHDGAAIQSDVGADWQDYGAATASLFAQDILALGQADRLAIALNTDVMSGNDLFLARLNPQAAWTHGLGDGLSIRVLGAAKTRFPTLKEWFSPEIGNPDLKPEQCVSVEVELSKRTAAGSALSLVAYEQHVKDMIVTAGWGDPARNIGSARSRGAELAVRQRVTERFDVNVGFAMTSARDMESDSFVPLVPRTTCSLTALYEQGAARFVTTATRVGSRSGLGGESLDPYYLMEVRGFYDTSWGTLFAGVENVFDVLYEDEEGFPQPGRGFEIGIMREFHE